ncbi:hypothetical protein [Streptococcus sobrinus]|uniref:DUF3796 domain-containing protein n=4 Tax=Streptococcus sobrinus TaxID=1310 RepID=U2J840_9STRE|nr:hypothetical protein [Streptococcus sobrinus]AWN19716.1 hypothetical protein DK181_09955 [Streptococcus sobrinus]AWN21660.1 hypothetical protein DK182_10190 [Streptococcus sobrinus]AWN62440.1 hypothetical protein DLJ52_09865 [Streptococcus sobrinus]AWN64315.1 hypothetical protein DLJ51_09870 [Streptococcus sobrinus]EMP72111.1 hypothetical protein D823_04931 [Streptococcus sobrinus DSM 20742 = ATCC 33478]
MLKNYKWLYWIWVPTLILLYFLTPASTPAWIKGLVFTVTGLFLALIFGIMSSVRLVNTKERSFGLAEKLYLSTLFFAMAIYSLGLEMLTPATHPAWLKEGILGAAFFLLLFLGAYFCWKKTSERPDERFYQDLAKAASLSLGLIICSLLGLAVITIWFPFALTPGGLLIYIGALLTLFAVCFWVFEKSE